MDITNYTTEHRKVQHLLSEERHKIEVRLKDGWSTITGDNGSEFAGLSLLENGKLTCLLLGALHSRLRPSFREPTLFYYDLLLF